MVHYINQLQKQGFTENFVIESKVKMRDSKFNYFSPKDVKIVESHRIEGDSDPTHQSIVFGIKSNDGDHKGIIVNSFGVDSDETTSAFIENIEKN